MLLSATNLTSAQIAAVTVAGTPGVNVRSCPALDCDVLAIAHLGESLTPTGNSESGFTPVNFNGVNGYAFSLYLVAPGQDLWFRQGQPGCQRVALMFNIVVGYEPSVSIVDTLISTGTAATMFPMGYFASDYPGYTQRLNDAGFAIGTHGQDMVYMTELGPDQIKWDVNTSLEVIAGVTGNEPEPLFTPYASDTSPFVRSVVASLGVLPVGRNVAAIDYTWTATEDSVYSDVLNNVYDGAIVELHLDAPATSSSTALALPRIIADLTAQGYTFVTIPDMILPCGN